MRRLTLGILLMLCMSCLVSWGQERTDTTCYPIINEDHSVTFKVKAPKALSVILKGNFKPTAAYKETKAGKIAQKGKIAMKKKGEFWTYTTPPLVSELYTYNFLIDDAVFLDPRNPNFIRDIDDFLSYFIIDEGIGDNYLVQDVPHGKIKKVWYPSSFPNMPERRMSVYTPAEYDENTTESYPVLYLLHGSGGDENAWLDSGRAAQILDNLIAANQCVPMIVVMPNGNVELAAAPGEDPNHPDVMPSANNMESMFGKIEKVFVKEVVGFIEENYRVRTEKGSRAIAGLSLGGLHTLYISLNNPCTFDYVGLFSAQTTNALTDKSIENLRNLNNSVNSIRKNLPFLKGFRLKGKIGMIAGGELDIYEDLDQKLDVQFQEEPRLYYIALGRDDFVKKLNDDFREKLDAQGYKYVYHETDGAHTWENWRKYLVDFLPRLFK